MVPVPMPATRKSANSILRKEAVGFSLIIALSWAAELLELPHLLFGGPAAPNWTRALLRTLVIVAVWIWVHLATKRLLKRLHELEDFLHICSWCRRVGNEGEWQTTEQYFGSKFHKETSHGICPECAKGAMARAGMDPFPESNRVSGRKDG